MGVWTVAMTLPHNTDELHPRDCIHASMEGLSRER